MHAYKTNAYGRSFNTAGPNRLEVEYTIEKGLQQTADYIDRCGSVDDGHLIIFDRSQTRTWEERILHRLAEHGGHKIMIWGM